MRPATQVDKIALAIQRNILSRRNAGDDLGLIVLAHVLEEHHRLIARHHAARHRDIFLGQLDHLFFNGYQILRRKRALIRKIVIKPIVNHGSYGHLRLGEQFLYCVCQQMRS